MSDRTRVHVHCANRLCVQNALLSSRLGRYISKNRWLLVEEVEEADVVCVSTCLVDAKHIDDSQAAVRAVAGRARPDARILAVGCSEGLENEAADPRVRNISYRELGELDGELAAVEPIEGVEENLIYTHVRGDEPAWPSTYWNVDLRNSCVFECAYCFIRAAKGKKELRTPSKPLDVILEEVERGRRLGHRHVYLVGDDAGSWGLDADLSFPELLSALAEQAPDIKLRLDYLHPRHFLKYKDAVTESAAAGQLAYACVPIQHWSRRIVKLMNRPYDPPEVLEELRRVKEKAPGFFAMNHMLFAFPTETREEFLESLERGTRVHDITYYFLCRLHSATPAYRICGDGAFEPDEIAWRRERIETFAPGRVVLGEGGEARSVQGIGMAKEEAARGGPGRPGRPGDAVGGRSTLSFPETSWARNLMRQAPPRVGLVKLRPGARHALPAYGVASLAAYLARHADCETLVTDLSDGGPEDWEKTPDFLLNVGFAWDLLVVDVDLEARDALRTLYDWCARLAAARRVNPGITLVVTGHLPSTRPEDAAAHPGALFVKGEAEQTLLDILRARRGEMDLRQVRGLAFAEGGEIVRTPAREILAATEIPSPTFNTWAALGGDYRPLGSLAERTATARMGVIRVTRGGGRRGSRRWEIFGPEERRKPIDRVLLEIDNYNALGATELVFDDDRLLADRGHAEETLSALGEQGGRPPCSFPCGFTFEGTPPDLLDRLATLTPCHVLIGPAEGLGGWRALLADEVRRREARELLSRAAGLGLLVHTTVPAGWPDAGEGELDRLVDLLSVGEIHGVEVMPWPESFAADGLGQPYDLAALDRLLALSLDRLTTSASVERMSAFGVRPAEAFVLNPAQHWKSLRAEVSRDG